MSRVEHAVASKERPLLGIAVHRYDPMFVELAAYLGYEVLWIEMEHAHLGFAETQELCRLASALGLLTLIRIPDSRRENVLKAAECGPDIIDLPMANSRAVVEELVSHALYPPLGNRGFFGSSRAVRYCVFADVAQEQERINRDLCVMIQIETQEAVDVVEELCQVPGVAALFIGRGDLSASMGVTGQVNHPQVLAAAEKVISAAKKSGKIVAVPAGPTEAAYWAELGAGILFLGSDVGCLRSGAEALIRQARDTILSQKNDA